MRESSFQAQVIKWLKSKGCFVMKVQAGPGVPSGTADVFFCKGPVYGFIECKRDKGSPFQPGQKEFLEHIGRYTYAKKLYPEIFEEEKLYLEKLLSGAEKKMALLNKNGRCSIEGCTRPARSRKSGLCSSHYGQMLNSGKIVRNKIRSCGERKKHPLYKTWKSMLARCASKGNEYYGGRGIEVCERWRDREKGFYNFVDDMGMPEHDGDTLDRIDVDGPYSPNNCRWADRHTQAINQERAKKDGLNNIYKRETKSGVRWNVCMRKGSDTYDKTFMSLEDAVEYRDKIKELLWPR